MQSYMYIGIRHLWAWVGHMTCRIEGRWGNQVLEIKLQTTNAMLADTYIPVEIKSGKSCCGFSHHKNDVISLETT